MYFNILTPSFNQSVYLLRCVASVWNQVGSQSGTVDRCSLLAIRKPQLLIAGDGPDRGALEDLSENLDISSSVKFLGKQPKEVILDLMNGAKFLVLPSLWYEGFPMTIVEAFSQGLLVIASNLGGMASVIVHNETGLLFEQGNSDDLAEKIRVGFRDADAVDRMSDLARHQFNTKYTDQIQFQQLTAVYNALG